MNTEKLSPIMEWLKETDLTEITYRRQGTGFEIKTLGAAPRKSTFTCTLTPVASPAVGIFRKHGKGIAHTAKEGDTVKAGQTLGIVEMFKTTQAVVAPAAGVLRVADIDDGEAVQYGQPLFFIEPQK